MEYREIENKKYYVTMTDEFLSGWGMAENKDNKLVIGCDTYEEAEIVRNNSKDRSEMKYIYIRSTKPRFKEKYYFVTYHDKTDYPNFFKKNYFRKLD